MTANVDEPIEIGLEINDSPSVNETVDVDLVSKQQEPEPGNISAVVDEPQWIFLLNNFFFNLTC